MYLNLFDFCLQFRFKLKYWFFYLAFLTNLSFSVGNKTIISYFSSKIKNSRIFYFQDTIFFSVGIILKKLNILEKFYRSNIKGNYIFIKYISLHINKFFENNFYLIFFFFYGFTKNFFFFLSLPFFKPLFFFFRPKFSFYKNKLKRYKCIKKVYRKNILKSEIFIN